MRITIYSNKQDVVTTAVANSNSFVYNEIMGDSYLQLEWKSGDYVSVKRDSYVFYEGVKYTLIQAVNVEKINTSEYSYSARFEAPQGLLENIIMSHMAGEGQISTKAYERNFSLAGTAREHVEMLLRNTSERLHVNFKLGSIDESLTGVKVVAYNVVSCKSALQLIANAFECEWWVSGDETEGYSINLGKCSFGEDNPTRLAYGYDNGILSGAKRSLHQDAQRMTHIAIQGGNQNINTLSQLTDKDGNPIQAYGFSTLHLPRLNNTDANGVGSIYYDVKSNRFEGESGYSQDSAVLLTVDRNANTVTSSLFNEGYDVIVERAYDMSEFYPQATRRVSDFGFQRNDTEFYIEDSSIEEACNYKSYQLGGEKITITFQTGALAGKTFDVINYDHDNRRFECALADYDTISMPSVTEAMWRPVVGEEFIVYGTALPASYFHDTTTDPFSGAEWDMLRRTANILCENFEDKYAYSLQIDSNWLGRRTEDERSRLKCGFWVHFVDNQLCGGGIDIRITSVKQYLTRPLQPEITIGDEVKTVSVAQKLQQIQSNVSATHNYVKDVQEQTQKEIQQVQQNANITIEQILKDGVEVAKINSTSIYAPQGSGGTQVQADWNQKNASEPSYIKNKPTIPNPTTVSQTLTSGAEIAKVDNVSIYTWEKDTSLSEESTDDHVPSSKCTWSYIKTIGEVVSILDRDKVSKVILSSILEKYCTLDYLKENYVTKSLIELAFSLTVAKKDLDSEVGALDYIKSADTSDLLKKDGSNGTQAGVSALINKLATATETPQDEDYIISQYAGGGTSNTNYYRRPMSALWKWIKSKTDAEYKPTQWTPFVASSSAPAGAMVIIGTITHTPSSNKSWQITIRMLGKHGGSYYGDTTVRLAGVDSSTQVNIKEISFVAGSISVPSVRAYRVSDTEISVGVAKNHSWTGMDCIIENLDGTDFVTSTAQETKSYNASYLLACNSMPYGKPDNLLTDKNCVEKLASHAIGRYALVFRIYGDYAKYQYQILRYHGVTLDTSRTSSSSTKPNLDLCVTIDGMEDENDYCDFLEKHQLHVSYSGETNSGEFKQVEALGSVTVKTVNSDSFLHIRFNSNAFVTDRQVTVSLAFEHMTAW